MDGSLLSNLLSSISFYCCMLGLSSTVEICGGLLNFRLCYFSWVDNFFLIVLNCLARVI